MHFPQLLSCIKGGPKSANCSHPRLSKSPFNGGSSTRPTDEPSRSLRRRQSRASFKGNEIDVHIDMPSSRRHRLPTTAGELQEVFQKFDGNGDGRMSWSDLGMLMTSLGCPVTEEELRVMISIADSDGDGFIDLSDFVVMNTFSVDEMRSLHHMESTFDILDLDGNGLISPDELLKVFDGLGHSSSLEDCRSIIAGVDSNRDGCVSFDEFLIMMITPSA